MADLRSFRENAVSATLSRFARWHIHVPKGFDHSNSLILTNHAVLLTNHAVLLTNHAVILNSIQDPSEIPKLPLSTAARPGAKPSSVTPSTACEIDRSLRSNHCLDPKHYRPRSQMDPAVKDDDSGSPWCTVQR